MFHTTRLIFCYVVVPLLLFSCNEKKEIRTDILPEEKMMAVLTDIHFAEAAADYKHLTADSTQMLLAGYYAQIFKIHHIDSRQFFKSFDYYLYNPDKMEILYQDILNEISKKEEELKN